MSPDASTAELRAAYRRLARRVHPDAMAAADRTIAGSAPAPGGQLRHDMAALNEAWRVLSEPGRRASYDAGLRRTTVPASPPGAGRPKAGVHEAVEPDGEFDDVEFVPAPAWKQRMPVWAMLSLLAMAVIFLATAYAGSATGPASSVPAVDGVLAVGSCARVVSGGVAVEAACAGPHEGVVAALIGFDGRCPPSSAGYRRRDGGPGYACLRDG